MRIRAPYRSIAAAAAGLALFGCSRAPSEQAASRPADAPRPAAAHGAPVPAGHGEGGLQFTAQEGWVAETPTSSMRKAQYRLARAEGDGEDAELVVFYFQGQGGSVQANIDRWIGQFQKSDGSPAADTAKISKKTAHAIPLTVVDVAGTYGGAGGPMMQSSGPKTNFRMLAAVAEASSGPWFFKLTGPARTVARWEASFQSFLDTIR